ncbi:SRPBCC family protein [Opitutus sp. GAS368]|jgi:uncharacterized membrane protein YhaH (DUF805 family)|uniref:SRPBCC family protein n=1 Tax=Opitutus sp. GAS368 TaxID=1882749 RepID=UPI00087AC085|nr:SRPBCC family protein [Opitutus sp. GAS368]SDR98273.1 Protein of unknown function [Opitutus sp. GAS368]
MAMRASDLWTWRGTLVRGDYAKWGLMLFAIKYNLDRFIAAACFGRPWFPWTYLSSIPGPAPRPPAADLELDLILLLLSLPFIFWGLAMTLRRLRDAGWAKTLLVLFFVPFVNLMFFAFLCLQPTREPPAINAAPPRWWRRIFPAENPFAAAALGIAASVLLGLSLSYFSATYVKNYGWGLFVGTPFMMGFFGALFHSIARPRTWMECSLVAIVSILLVSALLVALAVEGLFCLLMAAPIGLVLAVLGATAGWIVQLERWSHQLDEVRLYAAAWLLAPALLTVESRLPAATPLFAATTVCEIAAPPEAVWRHVVAFGELPPPREKIFLAGIAYPVRARLDGHGVGAVRYCEFSTGPFVEPITVWDENRRLAFDVKAQPHPMREWSPYTEIHPAHLEGFFRSRRGEFRLTALPGGRTRLEGTTWYEQSIWPQAYWKPWSDYLVHAIHRRVLEHIKAETERATP